MSHLGRGFVSMPPNQPGLIVLTLKLMQRQAEVFHSIKGCEPYQILLQCPDEAFCTAVAFRFADKGRRTGDPQKRQFLLKHMRHILTALIMPESQAFGDALLKRPKGGADPLAHGL